MNLIFNEIKQFVVKFVNEKEYVGEDTGSSGFEPPTSIYIYKLQNNKKYLIIELEDKNIYKIIYPGKFIDFSVDCDGLTKYKFSNGSYYNNYYNSYNYQNKKIDYDNLDNDIHNYEYDSDISECETYKYFLFFELENNFNEQKLVEILQFCIDNSEKKKYLCVNNKFGLIEIYSFHNQVNKVFTNKIDYNNIFNKKFEINFKL